MDPEPTTEELQRAVDEERISLFDAALKDKVVYIGDNDGQCEVIH